jgi:hypothetical protein
MLSKLSTTYSGTASTPIPSRKKCRKKQAGDEGDGFSYFIPVGVDFLAIEIGEPLLFSSHDCDLFVGNRRETCGSFVFEK